MFDLNGERKYLNEAEREAFLAACLSEPDPARKALLLTLYYTGCRISEALNLPVGRLDLAAKAVVLETLKRRKGGYFRSVLVPDTLGELFTQLVAGKNPDEKIFGFSRTTAWRLVKAIMKMAQVTGIRACPKGLRHGFAVACVGKKVPLPTVQKWLGHAQIQTTAIYTNVQGDEELALAKEVWRQAKTDENHGGIFLRRGEILIAFLA